MKQELERHVHLGTDGQILAVLHKPKTNNMSNHPMRPRRKLTDTEKMIRATRIARGKTTLGKIEKLQAQLKAARRRETLASAKVKEITDAITAEARWFAAKQFTKELASGKAERDLLHEADKPTFYVDISTAKPKHDTK